MPEFPQPVIAEPDAYHLVVEEGHWQHVVDNHFKHVPTKSRFTSSEASVRLLIERTVTDITLPREFHRRGRYVITGLLHDVEGLCPDGHPEYRSLSSLSG